MSEGELKKQMRKDFFLAEDVNTHEGNGTAIRAWDAFKVLDEAKKDFPQYEAETTDIDAASKAILSHAKFIQKVYEWKAKWFGSEHP